MSPSASAAAATTRRPTPSTASARRATPVSLDGSSLIDIGSNSGVIVSLNNDMVQEVKVQSSNFAAEYGTGGMNVSGVTKSGTSKFHGVGLRLLARSHLRGQRSVEQHHPDAEAEEHVSVSRRQHRRPDQLRRQLHEEPRPPVLLRRHSKSSASRSTPGSSFTRTYLARDEERRLQRAAREPRLEPEQPRAAQDSAGVPERGTAGAEQRHAAVHDGDRPVLRVAVSRSELQRSQQPLQLRLQPARADEPLRLQDARRLEHQRTTRRPTCASRRRSETVESAARRLVGAGGRRRAADAEHRREPRPLLLRQRRHGAEPVDDQRGARQLQPADAGQPVREPRAASTRARAASPSTASSPPARRARICRPTSCTGGAAAARSATSGRRPTTSTRTTTRCSSATS